MMWKITAYPCVPADLACSHLSFNSICVASPRTVVATLQTSKRLLGTTSQFPVSVKAQDMMVRYPCPYYRIKRLLIKAAVLGGVSSTNPLPEMVKGAKSRTRDKIAHWSQYGEQDTSSKGTREFYPEQMALRNFIYKKVGEAATSFGYQEWEAPFIEPIDLYAAKSGEELVKKQSFTFTDRGGDFVTLRPELTPSLARMIAAKQGELTFPVRWWSFGPFWRYEQPQKGRTREFFQWNVDMLGSIPQRQTRN